MNTKGNIIKNIVKESINNFNKTANNNFLQKKVVTPSNITRKTSKVQKKLAPKFKKAQIANENNETSRSFPSHKSSTPPSKVFPVPSLLHLVKHVSYMLKQLTKTRILFPILLLGTFANIFLMAFGIAEANLFTEEAILGNWPGQFIVSTTIITLIVLTFFFIKKNKFIPRILLALFIAFLIFINLRYSHNSLLAYIQQIKLVGGFAFLFSLIGVLLITSFPILLSKNIYYPSAK